MVKALVTKAGGTASNLNVSANNNMISSVFDSIITNAGGEAMVLSYYWSSTEYGADDAWFYLSSQGSLNAWTSNGQDNKRDNKYVRAVFAY